MQATPHALQGIKVVDWTIWQFGPVAATMLGDLGADVVKIESLDGDPGRSVFSASWCRPESSGRTQRLLRGEPAQQAQRGS